MGIKTEIHDWTMCREQRLWNTQSTKGFFFFIRPHFLRLRDLSGRGSGKTIRARGDEWLQGNSVFPGTTALMCIWTHRLWQHTQDLLRIKENGVPALRGEWNKGSHSSPRSYLQLIPAGKGKTGFLQWSLTGFINHNSGQCPCPGVGGQHKTNPVIFLWSFGFILPCFGFFPPVFCMF